MLEKAIRDDLNKRAQRRMGVLRPVKVVLTNLQPDEVVPCEAVNNPEDPAAGTRTLHLTREVWIEHDDFMETPPFNGFTL